MTIEKLCKEIRMPDEVTSAVLAADTEYGCVGHIERKLCDASAYAAAYEYAKELLTPDAHGLRMLKLMLGAALITEKKYEKAALDMRVFFDTMGCFSRFVREHKLSFGEYGFDRGWWTGRQLSLSLFRLGELEYEFAEYDGKRAIAVHIPSDADLTDEKTDESLNRAHEFMRVHFPEYENAVYFCESWLLSPALKKLLPPHSKILRFAERFRITETHEDATDYVLWVYKKADLRPENFPEDTTLQRNMKRFVLEGGKIGNGVGVLT